MPSIRCARTALAVPAVFGRARRMVAALPLAFLWALAPPWAAHCNAATVSSDLTLADALRAAADHNPALRAGAFDLRALEGRRQQAGARSNPELSLELDNFGGSG